MNKAKVKRTLKKFYRRHKKYIDFITRLLAVMLVAILMASFFRGENKHYNYGVDLSHHNGKVDWGEVYNDGVSFTILRCGSGDYKTGEIIKDRRFSRNIFMARYYDMDTGIYFYSQATNEKEAVKEAKYAIRCARGHKLKLPIFIDIEDTGTGGKGRADGLSKKERTAIVLAFARTIKKAGYKPGVYANAYYLRTHLDVAAIEKANISVWLAEYRTGTMPNYEGHYDYWQYTSKGQVPGISGNVDLNRKAE